MYEIMYAGIAAEAYRNQALKQAKTGWLLRALRKSRKEERAHQEGPAPVVVGKLASTGAG